MTAEPRFENSLCSFDCAETTPPGTTGIREVRGCNKLSLSPALRAHTWNSLALWDIVRLLCDHHFE